MLTGCDTNHLPLSTPHFVGHVSLELMKSQLAIFQSQPAGTGFLNELIIRGLSVQGYYPASQAPGALKRAFQARTLWSDVHEESWTLERLTVPFRRNPITPQHLR